jgi:hypothetical protein
MLYIYIYNICVCLESSCYMCEYEACAMTDSRILDWKRNENTNIACANIAWKKISNFKYIYNSLVKTIIFKIIYHKIIISVQT